MKEIIKGDELYQNILNAVNMICNAVSSTLGPCGNNVLINTDDKSPYITNDGVTIASSIESSDIIINSIINIIKESSLKTNEEVGDGTTTTLVLLQSIINDGINEIKKGKNGFILKNELNEVLTKVIDELNKLKIKPTKKDLLNIALTSSNEKEVGVISYEVFNKMKSKYTIKLEESNDSKTYYKNKKGYVLNIDDIPNIYFTKDNNIELKNVYLLIIRGYLQNLEQISEIVNEGYERNKNIVILCSDYGDNIQEQIILYKLKENKNIFIFKTPEYGLRKIDIEEDVASLTNATIKNIDFEIISSNNLGFADNIIINKENIIIVNENNNIKKRIKTLKSLLNSNISLYDKEFIESRISYLTKGVAYIYVGGKTKIEIKEKAMRFEDTINALENSKYGIVYGEGISYLKVSNLLNKEVLSENIIKNALEKPFQKIFENAGINYIDIKNNIIKSNYTKIYNFKTNNIEEISTSNIIDPLKVEIVALKNAISIASMLLTTNYLIINESNIKSKTDL